MTDSPVLKIAIIGAGIAGLTAAIALKDNPALDVQIYERASELKEIGASIALGPNGMRTLDRLGIDNALDESIAFRNKSGRPMIYRHYKTDEVVSVDKHRGQVEYRHRTARFHRPHLQEALLAHIDAPRTLHLSKAFHSVAEGAAEGGGGLTIAFADGTAATADVVLGADGIHSAVRRFFVPASRPRWTGRVAFRSAFPLLPHLAHIPEADLPDEAEHIWGPGPDRRALFVSRLGRGLFTVVGSHQAADPDRPAGEEAAMRDAAWGSAGDVALLRAYYRDWSPRARAIVDAVPWTGVYPNTSAERLDSWVLRVGGPGGTGGRAAVTLAGDAAHAHGGAFAAGGSLAIDDAWAFAAAVLHVFSPSSSSSSSSSSSTSPSSQTRTKAEGIDLALRLFEKTRKAHTDRVMETVHRGNLKKIERMGVVETDEELRARMKDRGDPSWIHEHNVQAAFEGSLAALDEGQGQLASHL